MHFAARSAFDRADTALEHDLQGAREQGDLIDLTVSNPTRCGFAPHTDLLVPLSDAGALQYDANALGLGSAREALSQMFQQRYRADIPADRMLLTASTSEAYSYLLRLFCEPGDAILVPTPSYPLFDLLARLHDVELIGYPLVYHDGWQIDPASLHAAVTSRTRAIVAIHPNNPTGHYCSATDRKVLLQCARSHDLPLIVDEVFLDYAVEGKSISFASSLWPPDAGIAPEADPPVLTFVLGGLSKLLCLPQMKLAWTAVCGSPELAEEAMHRLAIIADTFLSVATPPQLALPTWLHACDRIQAEVLERVRANLAWLDGMIEDTPLSRLKVEGAWAVVLRVPANEDDTLLSARLLRDYRVVTHAGSLYGFAGRGWLVVSLLTPLESFREGIGRILSAV